MIGTTGSTGGTRTHTLLAADFKSASSANSDTVP